MKKVLLLLPLAVLAGLCWWMLGEPAAFEEAVRVDEPEATPAPAASALQGVDPAGASRGSSQPARAELALDEAAAEQVAEADDMGVVVLALDADSKRLAGARVGWKHGEGAGSMATDESGVALLPITPPLTRAELVANLDGYATTRTWVSGSGPFTLKLFELTSLSGRVLEAATRAPLAGVELRVSHGKCDRCARDVAVSAADGSYAFAEIPAGTDLRIFAEGPDVAGQTTALRLGSEGAPHVHDFLLERGYLIRGSVVDLVDRAPIEGAQVSAPKGGGSSVSTDASGRFALRAVPAAVSYRPELPEAVVLRVESEGRAVLEADLTRSGTDLSAFVELPLVRTAAIEGVVRDADGQPVAKAWVTLAHGDEASALRGLGYVKEYKPSSSTSRPTKPNEDATPRSPLDDLPEGWRWTPEKRKPAVTDDEGRYTLEGQLPWQFGVELQASAHGFERVRVDLPRFPGPGEVARRDLVLTRSSAGAVVLGDLTVNGRAVHGRVEWRQGAASGSAMVVRNPYRIPGLQPGPVELEVRPYGFHMGAPAIGGLEGHLRTLEVPAEGELRADFDVRVELASIEGVTVDGRGDPIAGVYVVALLDGMLMAKSAPTDESGSFAIEVPAEAGPYTLSASRQNDGTRLEGIAAGEAGLRIVLVRSGQLLFRARDAGTGTELAPLVHWRRDETEPLRRAWKPSSPDPDGWRSLDLPAGALDVRLADAAGEFLPLRTTVRLSAGTPTRLDADLERGLAVTLTFEPPLPEDLMVFLVPDDDGSSWSASAGALEPDGRLRLPPFARVGLRGVAPGTYRLTALDDGGDALDVVWIPATLKLAAGSNEHSIRWTRRP